MYFTETPSLREIEKAMKMVPNFTPRGHGVVILCKREFAEKSCIGDSQKEILARTVSESACLRYVCRTRKAENTCR